MSWDSLGPHVTSFTFSVGIDTRLGRPLGMYLNDNRFPGALLVDYVSSDHSTLIGQWNADNPEASIRTGDLVVAVNDKKGYATYLRQLTKSLDFLEFTVVRHKKALEPHRVHPTTIKRAAEVFNSTVLR